MDLTSTKYLVKLAAFAEAHQFKITAGGATSGHNPGSLHYLGRAIDVSVKGKTNAEVKASMDRARECGFRALDERVRLDGEVVWAGPHLHIEDRDGMSAMDDREVGQKLWRWARWLDHEMNSAFSACSMEELEALRVEGLGEYEEWRTVRESIHHAHPWLKEKPHER